ncbi:Serine phosphatase RsbU, regulator of sigma subunit [Olavius sp. associated proteobacterium Delta 1]|nr:Serine phosphatase RsbU, regulator of sigma subunit [Olavius sp. associated proteobacterium Delta 1]
MLKIPGYHVNEKIYESSRSVVYRAKQLAGERSVILKTLKADYPLPEEVLRYRREYETIHPLNIEGIPRPAGLERISNRLVLITEDIGGQDLKALLKIRTFTLQQLLTMAIELVRILGEIHSASLVHGDIKTSNIIYNPEADRLQIIDFGSSRALSGAGSIGEIQGLAGTLSYMSPEQTGRMNRPVDWRTDFYSLGVVLYEMFSGRLPFETTDALELVHAHIARKPARPSKLNSEVPEGLSDVIIKLLAKNPEDRYQTAAGLEVDLAECLQRLERTGRIKSFPLGRQDVSDNFQISRKLVGRHKELETLMAAYDRVSRGGKEMMLIAGQAGIGKTALVIEAGKGVAHREGIFLQGQFDAPDRSVPYATFVTAFHDLVRQLLTESQQRLILWRDRILAALGSNGQILLDLIPDAVAIIGNQPPVMELEPAAAQRRIKAVMLNFIRIFCRPEHPLVLFLDFLNQADSDSLDLIKSLMADEGIDFLFLIGAYRDDDVGADHPLLQFREALQQQGGIVEQLDLAGLSGEHVALITAETLKHEPRTVDPLARILMEKTRGNPFFLIEFLNLLYAENLLNFDVNHRSWQWDISGIRNRMITDNVVDLLSDKLQRLDDESQAVVAWAAAIGTLFDLQTLAVACEKSRQQTAAALRPVLAEGLIMPIGDASIDQFWDAGIQSLLDAPSDLLLNSEFKFAHDRIHQAAYALIAVDERPMVHLQIGKRLQQSSSPDNKPDRIFVVIDQLNAGRYLLTGDAERITLAELNLSAGKRAKTAAIFSAALRSFKTGLELLGENCWDAYYDLALALHIEAAEMSYLCSDDDDMENLVQVVLRHARSPLDKAAAHEIKIHALTAQNRWAEAAKEALEILQKLGLDLPTAPGKLQVEMSLLKTKFMLTGKSFDHLAQLPPMTDPYKTAIMRIAMKANAALMTIYPDLYPILANEMIRLTVQHGSGPVSATAYLNYGMLLGSRGDMESGYQFGLLAMRLLEQPQGELSRIPSRFAFNWVMRQWKEPLRATLAPILEINQSAREIGDPFYIAYTSAYYIVHMFYCGLELPAIEQAVSEHDQIVKATGVDAAYNFMQLYRQVVSNLINSAADPCRLTGEFYDEESMLAIDTEADNKGRDFGLYNCKLLLCLLHRQYKRAVKNADRVQQVLEGGTSLGSSVPAFYCWNSLARLGDYPEAAADEKKMILKQVETSQEKLRQLAQQSPVNYRHKYDLVNAERHRVLGRDSEAMALFDRVIQRARESEYLYDVALANEMTARFYLEKNRTAIARSYMTEARYAYLRWGAAAKVRDLEETYPELLSGIMASNQPGFLAGLTEMTTTSSDVTEALDLASVLKSTQAMSSEIVLANLLEKLLNLTMENAGAQKGFLVLESGGKLLVEAEMLLDSQETTVRQSTPLDSSTALSKSIVNYVARTREPVVLDDAVNQGKFTHTPYVLKVRPKSILCMPLTTQDQLVGVLYLENNLAAGVFTAGHLEVLKMLSSQAAISLENARLYDKLADYSHSLEEIIAALNLAQEVQQNLLPQRPPRLATLDVAGRSLYCDETGGDYFDFIELSEDRLGVVIGDVSGHGVSAALLMASVRGFLRARATLSGSTASIITGVNRLISADTAETGQFMTLFYLVVEHQNRRITWVRAGHDPGLLYCPETDQFEELSGAGLALGVDEDWEFKDFNRTVKPGQIVLLTTDGIFEAHNPAGEMFGKARFKEVVRQNARLEAEGLRKVVYEAVTEFRGAEPQEDDITLVILKFQ